MNCENCGLPPGAITNAGVSVTFTRKADNKFLREKRVTVWCCCRECAIQARAVARYGIATHKWPITLKQARTLFKRGLESCQK